MKSRAGCAPFLFGKVEAHLQRVCVARFPPSHPLLFSSRVLGSTPQPPFKGGLRVVLGHPRNPTGFDFRNGVAASLPREPLCGFNACVAATHSLWWEGVREGVGLAPPRLLITAVMTKSVSTYQLAYFHPRYSDTNGIVVTGIGYYYCYY